MAAVTKCGTTYSNIYTFGVQDSAMIIGGPSIATLNPPASVQTAGLLAGALIQPGDACYIKTSDGKVYPAIATNGTANSDQVRGFAEFAAQIGQPITLMRGIEWNYYASTYTALPGNPVYLSGTTAGGLVDSTYYGGQLPVGYFVDTNGRVVLYEARL